MGSADGDFFSRLAKNFFVGETALRPDDRRIKFRLQDSAVIGKEKLDAFRQAKDIGLERAKLVAQRFGQHRNDAIDQICGIAAFARLDVEGAVGLDVMRDVGDVDPKFPLVRSWKSLGTT